MRDVRTILLRLAAPLGLLAALILPALASTQPAQVQPFTEGGLVVYRVGDGAALVDTGNPVFLDEFDPATGALVQSIPMPTEASGANRALFAGDRVEEGLITRSADGRRLIVTGYSARTPSTTPLQTTTGTVVPRVIAQVAADGSIVSSTAPSDFASSGVPASAASPDGFNFWATGTAGGVRYAPASATSSTQVVASPGRLYQLAIFDGQLYGSTDAGSLSIGTIGAGVPPVEGQSFSQLPGVPATNVPYGFFLADLSPTVAGLDTLYVAYDDAGIGKYTLAGGTWSASGTVGSDDDDYRGLSATVDGTTVTLYATRRASELVRLVDGSGYGGALAGEPALLAAAPAGTAFRGVALAPRPGEARPDLSVSVSGPSTAQVGTAFTYVLRVRNGGAFRAEGVTVRLALPAGVDYIDAEGAGFTASEAGGVVRFSGGAIGVGGQASLLVSVAAGAVGPVTLPPGAAVVDPEDAIAELDEENNSSAQTVVTRIVPEGGPPADTTPPGTTITGRPGERTTDTTATFTFTGEDETTAAEALVFQCSLDGGPFEPCTSPQVYTGLAVGSHSFQVRAVDAAGNEDVSPASHSWAVWARLLAPLVVR